MLAGDAVDVERLEDTRLDAASSVVVRTSADVIAGVLLVGLAGVVALVVGLRFAALAHRAEDDLFEVVGAPVPPCAASPPGRGRSSPSSGWAWAWRSA